VRTTACLLYKNPTGQPASRTEPLWDRHLRRGHRWYITGSPFPHGRTSLHNALDLLRLKVKKPIDPDQKKKDKTPMEKVRVPCLAAGSPSIATRVITVLPFACVHSAAPERGGRPRHSELALWRYLHAQRGTGPLSPQPSPRVHCCVGVCLIIAGLGVPSPISPFAGGDEEPLLPSHQAVGEQRVYASRRADPGWFFPIVNAAMFRSCCCGSRAQLFGHSAHLSLSLALALPLSLSRGWIDLGGAAPPNGRGAGAV
jgi:hypothetical protein